MIKKVARSVRKLTLVGALVGAASLWASATETAEKAAPTVERLETVKLQQVKQNLEAVVAALAIIDPAWAGRLNGPKRDGSAALKTGSTAKANDTPQGFWILTAEGRYVYSATLPPSGDCQATLPHPCYVEKTSSSDIPTEFPAANLSMYSFDDVSSENGPYL